MHRRLVRLAGRVVLERDLPRIAARTLLGDRHSDRIAWRDRQRDLLRSRRQHLDPGLELRLPIARGDILCPGLDQVAAADAADTHPCRAHARCACRRQLGNGPGAANAGVRATGGGVAGPVVRRALRARRNGRDRSNRGWRRRLRRSCTWRLARGRNRRLAAARCYRSRRLLIILYDPGAILLDQRVDVGVCRLSGGAVAECRYPRFVAGGAGGRPIDGDGTPRQIRQLNARDALRNQVLIDLYELLVVSRRCRVAH